MEQFDIVYTKKYSSKEGIFSIIIPTWNNIEYLKICIESIRKNSTLKHQIIVHVNEGKDETLSWLESQPDIDYTFSKENIGVCFALNACRSFVDTDYILYSNDDMYFCPLWDKYLYDEIISIKHKYFALSATSIERNPQSICSIEKNYGSGIENFDEALLLKEYAALPFKDWMGATYPPNMVHRDLWDIVGGYSIEFTPGWFADQDFSLKLWEAGVRYFKGVSASRVYHFLNKTTGRTKKNRGYYKFIAKWRFTARTFTDIILKRGMPFAGPATEPANLDQLKRNDFLKRVETIFKKY
jgi:GT2 family glycosyltransferase